MVTLRAHRPYGNDAPDCHRSRTSPLTDPLTVSSHGCDRACDAAKPPLLEATGTQRRVPETRRMCLLLNYDCSRATVAYWTDIFTLETWAQARARDFTVTGFPPPTPGKGGYSVGMFDRVEIGDVFLCYCKSPASRWVGALRTSGKVFQSDEPVWGLTDGRCALSLAVPGDAGGGARSGGGNTRK